MSEKQNVYEKIVLVQAALCAEGISKDRDSVRTLDRLPGYVFTDCGNVYSKKKGRFVNVKPNRFGYVRTKLGGAYVSVHRVICEAFHGPSDLTVNHKNGVKHDNRAENLEWATVSQNTKHAYDIGLRTIGAEHRKRCSEMGKRRSPVTDTQRSAIAGMYTGKRGDMAEIGRRLGLTRYVVADVLRWFK